MKYRVSSSADRLSNSRRLTDKLGETQKGSIVHIVEFNVPDPVRHAHEHFE